MTPFERRLAAAKGDVAAVARQLLRKSAPDPADPECADCHLTCEEIARLETAALAAIEDGDDRAIAAWTDAQRRAVARM